MVFSNFNSGAAEVEILIYALNNFTSRTNGLKRLKSLQESSNSYLIAMVFDISYRRDKCKSNSGWWRRLYYVGSAGND